MPASTEAISLEASTHNPSSDDADDAPLAGIEDADDRPRDDDDLEEPSAGTDNRWHDVLGGGTVMRRTVSPGSGPSPEYKCAAYVHYVARIQGHEDTYENTRDLGEDPVEVVIGDNIMETVVPGLMLGIRLMKEGEIADIKVNHRFGYADQGFKDLVGPNEDIEFRVELVRVGEREKEPVEMDPQELIQHVRKRKERGNAFFVLDRIDKALQCYQDGLKRSESHLPPAPQPGEEPPPEPEHDPYNDNPELIKLRAQCAGNAAACFEKLKKWKEAGDACVAALALDPQNLKYLLRAANVSTMRGNFEEAKACLHTAKLVYPDNPSVSVAVRKFKSHVSAYKEKEKEAYGGFLHQSGASSSSSSSSFAQAAGTTTTPSTRATSSSSSAFASSPRTTGSSSSSSSSSMSASPQQYQSGINESVPHESGSSGVGSSSSVSASSSSVASGSAAGSPASSTDSPAASDDPHPVAAEEPTSGTHKRRRRMSTQQRLFNLMVLLAPTLVAVLAFVVILPSQATAAPVLAKETNLMGPWANESKDLAQKILRDASLDSLTCEGRQQRGSCCICQNIMQQAAMRQEKAKNAYPERSVQVGFRQDGKRFLPFHLSEEVGLTILERICGRFPVDIPADHPDMDEAKRASNKACHAFLDSFHDDFLKVLTTPFPDEASLIKRACSDVIGVCPVRTHKWYETIRELGFAYMNMPCTVCTGVSNLLTETKQNTDLDTLLALLRAPSSMCAQLRVNIPAQETRVSQVASVIGDACIDLIYENRAVIKEILKGDNSTEGSSSSCPRELNIQLCAAHCPASVLEMAEI